MMLQDAVKKPHKRFAACLQCLDRCDHEGKRGAVVQEQLNQLWQLGEELQVQLPQLHDHLNHLSGQMMEMQLRHQEVMWQQCRWSSFQQSD